MATRKKTDPQIRQMALASRAALKSLRAKHQEDRRAQRASQMAARVDYRLEAKKLFAALLRRQKVAQEQLKQRQRADLDNMKRGQKEALLRVKQAIRMANASARSSHRGPPRGKVRYL